MKRRTIIKRMKGCNLGLDLWRLVRIDELGSKAVVMKVLSIEN